MKQQPSFKHFSDATLRGSKWAYGCDNSKVAAQRNEASIKPHDGIVLRDHQWNKDEHARDLPTKTPRMLTRLEYRPKTTPGKKVHSSVAHKEIDESRRAYRSRNIGRRW